MPRNSDRCGLFKFFFWFFYIAFLILFLAAFIFWLIFRPNEVKFNVTDASLTQFNFINTTDTLQYNLSLNITLRNSNKNIGVHYDRIEAFAYYEKKCFSKVVLTPFYQERKNTSVLRTVFEGQQVVPLSNLDFGKSDEVFSIDVMLSVQIRIEYGKFKTFRFKPRDIGCPLKVRLSYNGTVDEGFTKTQCEDAYFFSDPDTMH